MLGQTDDAWLANLEASEGMENRGSSRVGFPTRHFGKNFTLSGAGVASINVCVFVGLKNPMSRSAWIGVVLSVRDCV